MKIIDIAINDLVHSFRSAFAIGMMVVAPLILTGLIYFAFGGMSGGDVSMTAIKVGVVNADQLPVGSMAVSQNGTAALKESIGATIRAMFFDENVKTWISASDYADEAAARAALDKQQIGVAVVIPRDFSAQYFKAGSGSQPAQVLVISDPTLAIGPGVAANMVTSLLDGFTGGRIAIETLVSRQEANGAMTDPARVGKWIERYSNWYAEFQRSLFHDPQKAALVLIAPAAAGQNKSADPIGQMMGLTMAGQMIFFAFFTGANSMLSILREDEEGTLARMFTTPTDRTMILAGKFLAVFITVAIQGLVLIAAGTLAFGVKWGQPAAVALALVGQVAVASGLGVLLISFVKTTRQGGPVLGGGLTAMGMLGGLFTANLPNAMPAAFTMLANLTPQGWVLKAWRMVMSGQPASEILGPFGVMLGMGVVMFTLGAFMFKKRYA
jgi:ABC-type multidrug transport system permease subunit